MGDRLATIDMGQKLGVVPLWRGESLSNTTWPGGGLPPCQVSYSAVQPFGHKWHNTPTLQTGQDRKTVRQHRANRFTNGRTKNVVCHVANER